MDRKNIPLLLMLTAGAITCIITFIMRFSSLSKLVALFVVLVVFYVLGSALKWALDSFERQNQSEKTEEKSDKGEAEIEDSVEQVSLG